MDINTIVITIVGLFMSYIVYNSLPTPTPLRPTNFPWNQSTGKERSFVNKQGDASLYIEGQRRRAIQGSGRLNPSGIKESTYQVGSTTGALETFLITGICPPLPTYDVIYDGGTHGDEFCPYDGSGDPPLDAGDQTTKACGL